MLEHAVAIEEHHGGGQDERQRPAQYALPGYAAGPHVPPVGHGPHPNRVFKIFTNMDGFIHASGDSTVARGRLVRYAG